MKRIYVYGPIGSDRCRAVELYSAEEKKKLARDARLNFWIKVGAFFCGVLGSLSVAIAMWAIKDWLT